MAAPIFHLIVGPNGAGKTTFYEQWLKPRTNAEFVNPDLLAKDALGRWSQTRDDATLGQALAEARRNALMASRQSLIMESTFSHRSKLELVDRAIAAGYRLVVYHLGVRDADFAVERVLDREWQGGHPVPEENIRGRYERNGPIIRGAMLKADFGYVFDNSEDGRPPRLLLQMCAGQVTYLADDVPRWATEIYGDLLATPRR